MQGQPPSLAGLAIASLALLWAPDLSAQGDQATALEKVQGLEQEFQQASTKWMADYRAAAPKERNAMVAKRPQATQWFERFWKEVEAAPASDGARQAAIWIATHSAAKGPDLERTLGALLEHHVESDALAKVCSSLGRTPTQAAQNFLRQLEDKSPHAEVKGQACFNLAEVLKGQASLTRSLSSADDARKKMLAGYYGRETVDVLATADPAALDLQAEACFDKVVKTEAYAGLKNYRGTLGEAAKSNLFEMRQLGIGKTAPEISGEDIDGNPIKLSDYRGKVVVLDFWGHW
jgi:hypothetical protein